MKKIYSFLAILLILIFSIQPAFAEGAQTNSTELYINLEKAISLATENNPGIELIDKKIEIAEKKYQDAAEAAEDAKFDRSYNEKENLEYRKAEKLNWQYTKLELDSLKNDRKEAVEATKSTIQQYYVDAQFLKEDIKIIEQEVASIDNELFEVELKIQQGQLTETSYKTLISQKLSLQNSLNAANKQYNITLINLKKEMGIDINSKLTLEKVVLPYVIVDIKELEESISPYIEKDFSVLKLNKELELKELEKKLVMQYTDYEQDNSMPDLDMDIEEIKANIKMQKFNIETDLWIDYYDIKTLSENIALEELNLELEKINYDEISTKYKLGIVDATAELNAKIAYSRQKNNLQHAMYNYILAVDQFNKKLDI